MFSKYLFLRTPIEGHLCFFIFIGQTGYQSNLKILIKNATTNSHTKIIHIKNCIYINFVRKYITHTLILWRSTSKYFDLNVNTSSLCFLRHCLVIWNLFHMNITHNYFSLIGNIILILLNYTIFLHIWGI